MTRMRIPEARSTFPALVLFGLLLIAPSRAHAQEEAQADTTDDESLVADDDSSDAAWTLSLNPAFDSRTVRDGMDLSNGEGNVVSTFSVTHASGFNVGLSTMNVLDSAGGIQQWTADIGYGGKFSDMVGYSVTYSRTTYRNDSVNAVADMPNAIALGLSFDTKAVSVDLSWNHTFGTSRANFFTVDVASLQQMGRWTAKPNLGAIFGLETIAVKRVVYVRLPKKAKQGPHVVVRAKLKPVTVSGLTEIAADLDLTYDLGSGFRLTFDPAFIYTPIAELALEKTQFAWTAGVKYEVEF